jgi:hypothetical protein
VLGWLCRSKSVYCKTENLPLTSLHENADFSVGTIKASIKEGELRTNHILKDIFLLLNTPSLKE